MTRESMTGAERIRTRIWIPRPGPDALDQLARYYFESIRLLRAVDRDGDRLIGPSEIGEAAARLPGMDRNHDGVLDAVECGLRLDGIPPMSPDAVKRHELAYFALHPVLAALDRNADGRISPDEITLAAASLRRLDRNGDGYLSPAELLPSALDNELALILRIDTDCDGAIRPDERLAPLGVYYREFLDQADADQDGAVTREELRDALRESLDRNRDGRVEWREVLLLRAESAAGTSRKFMPQ